MRSIIGELQKILSEELGIEIIYTNPAPAFTKNTGPMSEAWTKILHSHEYALYDDAFWGRKNVTADFEQVMGKKPQTFQQFVKKNIACWK